MLVLGLLDSNGMVVVATVALCSLVAAVVSAVYTSLISSRRHLDMERMELNRRISSLEILQAGDFPRWIRSADKTIVSVTPQFVTLFGTPVGYSEYDFHGKKFTDLTRLSPCLVEALDKLDASLCEGHQYASISGVEVYPGVTATIMKAVVSTPRGTMFVGCAVPELEKRSQS